LVHAWVKQAETDAGRGPVGALTSAENEELSHLRKEMKILRMEREILKQAATFFAKGERVKRVVGWATNRNVDRITGKSLKGKALNAV
jgi:transposase-like protein